MGLRIGLAQDYLYMLTRFFSVNRLCLSQFHVCLSCRLLMSLLPLLHFPFHAASSLGFNSPTRYCAWLSVGRQMVLLLLRSYSRCMSLVVSFNRASCRRRRGKRLVSLSALSSCTLPSFLYHVALRPSSSFSHPCRTH
jgi:hypothetical protein